MLATVKQFNVESIMWSFNNILMVTCEEYTEVATIAPTTTTTAAAAIAMI